MSRTSKINHPPGGKFVQVHEWIVDSVGLTEAFVLGWLDFLDSWDGAPGRLLTTRLRLLADLEGFRGKNSIDIAVKRLVDMGWLRVHAVHERRDENHTTPHHYSLNAAAINEYLFSGTPGVPEMGRQASQNRDPNRDATNIVVDVDTATTTSAPPQQPQAASPPAGVRYELRASGIVTYHHPLDDQKATSIEAQHAAAEIEAAVNQVWAAGKQEPTPGVVLRAINRSRSQAKARAARDKAPREQPALDVEPSVTRARIDGARAAIQGRLTPATQPGDPHVNVN